MPYLSKGPGRQPECLPHASRPGDGRAPSPTRTSRPRDSGHCWCPQRPSRLPAPEVKTSPAGMLDFQTRRRGLAPQPHEPGPSKEEKKKSATNRNSATLAWALVRLLLAGTAERSQALGEGAGPLGSVPGSVCVDKPKPASQKGPQSNCAID